MPPDRGANPPDPSQRAEADALSAYFEALMRPAPAARPFVPGDAPADEAAVSDARAFHRPAAAFRCLPIVAGGVTLAVACDDVRAVLAPPLLADAIEPPRPLPWFAGYCRRRDGQATLVDLAVVIGARDRGAPVAAAVVVGDGRYALAGDAVGSAFDMHPAHVHWRGAGTRRPWLAGIETARRRALLDVRALVRLLAEEEGAPA
jgi:hypothetical protein